MTGMITGSKTQITGQRWSGRGPAVGEFSDHLKPELEIVTLVRGQPLSSAFFFFFFFFLGLILFVSVSSGNAGDGVAAARVLGFVFSFLSFWVFLLRSTSFQHDHH